MTALLRLFGLRLRLLSVRQADQVGYADHARNASRIGLGAGLLLGQVYHFRKPSPSRFQRQHLIGLEEPPNPNKPRSKRGRACLPLEAASSPPHAHSIY
jgi:hypothetical protein